MTFQCPKCGSEYFGSSSGPDGLLIRQCHGDDGACGFTFSENDDYLYFHDEGDYAATPVETILQNLIAAVKEYRTYALKGTCTVCDLSVGYFCDTCYLEGKMWKALNEYEREFEAAEAHTPDNPETKTKDNAAPNEAWNRKRNSAHYLSHEQRQNVIRQILTEQDTEQKDNR